MVELVHPTIARLIEFNTGFVGEAELKEISQHLSECPVCCKILQQLPQTDPLLDKLKEALQYPGPKATSANFWRFATQRRHETVIPDRPKADSLVDLEERIGDYRLLGEVGRGGMGVVYKAHDLKLNRTVALKMLLAGPFASPEQRLRFQREAELTARLQHPNIVAIYEVGTHRERPFLALEWIAGGSLANVIGGKPQPIRIASELVETLARAVHVAHQQGIIHRDLKPGNIMLLPQEAGKPQWPKIADFGLARDADTMQTMTKTGEILGTPEYMAPEQAAGRRISGPASDIYALGAILYELVSGQPPLHGLMPIDTLQQVLQQEPEDLVRRRPDCPRDLVTICSKCLEKEPTRRYGSAEFLAEDVRHFLAGEPIQARPITMWERTWKRICRNPLVFGLVFLVGFSLFAGSIISLRYANQAELHAQKAYILAKQALTDKEQADKARQVAEEAQRQLRRHLYASEMHLAGRASTAKGGQARLQELLEHWLPQPGLADLRGWEWHLLHGRGKQYLWKHQPPVKLEARVVRWHPKGEILVVGWEGGFLSLLHPKTGQEIARWQGHQAEVTGIDWSPDGKRFASSSMDKTIHVWDADTQQRLYSCLDHSNWVSSVSWSPDGKRLVSSSYDRSIKVWNAGDGQLLDTLAEHKDWTMKVAWSPTKLMFASAGADWVVCLWDAEQKTVRHRLLGHKHRIRSLRWNIAGTRIATGDTLGTIIVWNVETGAKEFILSNGMGEILDLSWSPSGKHLAAATSEGVIRQWNIEMQEELDPIHGHTHLLHGIDISPDGEIIASSGADGCVYGWKTSQPAPISTLATMGNAVHALAWHTDGKRLASTGGNIKLWDITQRKIIAECVGHKQTIHALAWNHTGTRLASVSDDTSCILWDEQGKMVHKLKGHDKEVRAVSWSPDQQKLVTGGRDKLIILWNADMGTELKRWNENLSSITCLAWGKESRLAAGLEGGRLTILDMKSYEVISSQLAHPRGVRCIAWSADQRTLASAGFDHQIKLWNTKDWTLRQTLSGHMDTVDALAWSEDGKRLISISSDGTLHCWDPMNHQEIITFELSTPTTAFSWFAASSCLVIADQKGRIQIWKP